MRLNLFTILWLAGGLCFLASCGERPSTSDRGPGAGVSDANMLNIVQEAVSEMREEELTGDPDYDFATLMSRHKEAGIQLAEEQIARGEDILLVEFAERILRNSQRDITRLEEFTEENSPEEEQRTFRDAVNRYLEVAENEVEQMNITSPDFDQEFAQAVGVHYDQGIRLARLYETYGQSSELIEIARNMIATQEAELRALDTYVSDEADI